MNFRAKYSRLLSLCSSRSLCSLLSLMLTAALASSCTRAQARVSPDVPALDVPLPPSRVIATNSPDVPPAVGTPSAVPSGIDGLNRSDPPRSPVTPPRRVEAPRPTDPPKPEVSTVADMPKSEETRPATSPLQNTPSQSEREVENAIRADMTRATANLNRIDYQKLSSDARQQYDLAKGHLVQVEEALRARNLPFAKNLVEKAVALAAQLGR